MTRNSRNMMKRIGQKLTAPSPRVTGHDKQRQAQLVAALLLSLIGLGFCVSFIGELGRSTGQAFHNSEFYITTTITVLLIPVYALSRTRHYQWSTISLIALSSIGTFIVAILDNGHTAETGVFAYLVLPLVLSSFFLTLRSTSILAGAQILGWFVFTQIFESPANLEMLGFQLMLATVILYGTHYRNVFEQDRQSDLRDAEERYRQLVELAPFTIAVQQHGKIAYINPAGINMLGGTTMTDFCGQPTINFVHPDYLDAAQKRIVQTSDTSRPSVIVEEKLIGLDGRIVEVETTALPLLFDGKPATQIIVRDLTGQRRAEAKQRASETQYHDLVQNLPFAIIRTTPGPHGTRIVQNPACLRMFGVESEDEFQAIPVSNFYVNPADRQAYSDRLLAEGHIDREEVQFQRANGALFWGSVTAQAIRDETGAVAYFDAVIEDITLRKEAAAAIQRNDAHLRALLSAIPDIIFQLNRAGIFTNYHAPDHNLLVPPQDFIGKSMREVLPDLAEQTHEYIARALATGDMQSYEYSVLADDGEPRYYEARMSPYTDDEVVVVVRDITAWKRLTESLRHERDLVARITETSPIAITTVSKEGRIIFANQRAEELLGLKKDAITQLTYNDPEWRITDYEGHPLPEEHLPFARVMTTRKHVYEIGHGIEWPNGRRVLLAINGAPIKNDAGEIEEVVFSLEDVTERFAVEQTMRVSEERYHNLFDNTLVGFAVHEIITDEVGKPIDYRFLELNRRFEQLTGLRAEDVIGRCITDIMLTTDSTYIERYGQVALTGEPTRFTDYFEPLDRYYDIAAFSPRNGQFATLFLDITDRVKAQAELADSEDRYRSLFDGINDIVLVHDLEGHILDVNDAACRRLEYSRAELMRMTLAQIDEPGTYADEFQERLQHQLATGALSGIQGAHLTKSGRRIAIDANTKVINYKGQQAVLAVSRDVTERNRTETLLRLQHDLITKLAAINDLETALNQVIDSIIGIDEIDNAAIYLIDPTTDTADMVYQRGLSPEYAAHVAHPERDSPQAQKVLQGQPVFCPYRDYLPELDTMRQSQGLQAFGLLPIQHDQQIIAALVVASHVYETFSPQVQHSLQAIAAQTGTFLVRIQTETALRRNEATLQSILRAAPVGLGMITNRTFGWINERFEDLIGYTAQEVAGQSARMIYESQHEYERVGQVKYGQIKAGAPVGTVETRLVHKDGSIADVLLSSSPVDPGDLAQGLITAAMDITERKRIEETLYFVGQQSWQGEESETFNAIVRFLGETLDIAVVMIGELVGNELEQVQSIALYKQGQTGETLTYPLPGTPCHNVVCQGTCVYPERVQTHFPEDQLLIDMGAASYAGTPLRDASGETLGILIAVDTKPMEKPNLIDSILQIVGARVAHEINRRRDARALQTSEARYRGVVETQTEFVVRCKPDGTRTFINDAYCRYFNQPREQLISKKFATVVPATDWSAIQEKFTRLTPEKPAETGIHRVIKPDGQIAWHEWVDQGIFDDAGQLVEIQSVGRDVTERVRIANELRQERDRAQQYLDIAGVILVALDTEGHITLINHKGREILGYSEAELLGQNWFERCLPPAEIETVSAFFKQAITGAAALPDHYQNTIQTRAGEIRLIAWHNTTLFDDTGQITGTLSSGEDITERERARRNIIESEARYSALIN
ncbi:MAG: PAS domain S-box protein, partial [Anaerolineae bacterium]|nr:PAS domain S-box protein [Anaerolineae bacterium]